MKIWKKIIIATLISILLGVVSILIFGKTTTSKVEIRDGVTNADDYSVVITNESIAECISKEIKKDTLMLKFRSISHGKTSYQVLLDGEEVFYGHVYVYKFGTITNEYIIGNVDGDIAIPILNTVLLIYILGLLIKRLISNMKQNIYQYRNIYYFGLVILVFFLAISQFVLIFNYNGLVNTINTLVSITGLMSFYLYPIAVIVSILITISNIVLIIKEGFSIRNMVGVVLGLILAITPYLPDVIYSYILQNGIIDIFNEQGIALYIYRFFEVSIYNVIAYSNCILIGTIIATYRAAKHIPKFDKDYIIILGCQIRKDGTLTKLLKGRVDRAIDFSKMQKENSNKDIIFVVSGGKGSDEVTSEAQAMKNYLLQCKIPEENILLEDKSKNTLENMKYSTELINNKNANIAYSTTNYHVFRAGVDASEFVKHAEGIGAKTRAYFWITAFIREFIATIRSEIKKHILMLILISFTTICMISLQYLANIM